MTPDTCANNELNVLKELYLFSSVTTNLSLDYILDKFPCYFWATCIDKHACALTPTANLRPLKSQLLHLILLPIGSFNLKMLYARTGWCVYPQL